MQHRWIVRNGEKVLQQTENPIKAGLDSSLWVDVPTVEEPKQTRIKWDGEDNGRSMRSCCQCGETVPVEFIGAEMHWCQPKYVPKPEPKKVDLLVEELANGFRNYADIGKNYEWSLAKYAVEFFKARMPIIDTNSQFEFTDGYAAGIRATKQALFGDKE